MTYPQEIDRLLDQLRREGQVTFTSATLHPVFILRALAQHQLRARLTVSTDETGTHFDLVLLPERTT